MKKIFIASSGAALKKATTLKGILDNLLSEYNLDGIVTIWNSYDVFHLTEFTWKALEKNAHEYSGGIFLFNTDDELMQKSPDGKATFIARDNVIAEAGLFAGALGSSSIVLCIVPGVHLPTDFNGITTLTYNPRRKEKMKQKLKTWVLGLKEPPDPARAPNVLIKSRNELHSLFPKDACLHISDGLYRNITSIRMMNLANNLTINPEIADMGHLKDNLSLSYGINKILQDTQVNFELILANPNSYDLKDIQTKIANCNAGGSPEGAIYSALAKLYESLNSDTIYRQLYQTNRFHLYLMNVSMPFGIFNVEFSDEYASLSHVKVDLYSACLSNERERRSFIIWKTTDPQNYDFFVNNFDMVKRNLSTIATKKELSEIATTWATMKKT